MTNQTLDILTQYTVDTDSNTKTPQNGDKTLCGVITDSH